MCRRSRPSPHHGRRSIAPELAAAQATRAFLFFVLDWDWPAADSAFRRALVLDPSYAVAHKWYADLHSLFGRIAAAQQEAERAWELDPVSGAAVTGLALRALRRGEQAEALRLFDHALVLDPTQPNALRQSASLLFDRGDSARFFAMQERFVTHSGNAGASTAVLRRAWQAGGREAALRAQIDALDRLQQPFEAGRWRMKAGDLDGVFRELDRAYDAHDIWMPQLKDYFTSSAVRRDPRCKALLARMNIPEDAP